MQYITFRCMCSLDNSAAIFNSELSAIEHFSCIVIMEFKNCVINFFMCELIYSYSVYERDSFFINLACLNSV